MKCLAEEDLSQSRPDQGLKLDCLTSSSLRCQPLGHWGAIDTLILMQIIIKLVNGDVKLSKN